MLFSAQTVMAYSEGVFKIDSNLTYHKFRSSRTITPGEFNAKVKVKSRKIIIKFKDSDGKRARIKVKTPRHFVPRRNGQFSLTSLQVKQPFDISGNVRTQSNRSSSRYREETCTYRQPVRNCRIDERGRRICRTVNEEIRGVRTIRYHILHERINTQLAFFSPDSTNKIADLNSFESKNTMVTEYRSRCRRY